LEFWRIGILRTPENLLSTTRTHRAGTYKHGAVLQYSVTPQLGANEVEDEDDDEYEYEAFDLRGPNFGNVC
jgi:hypothetical protein